MAFNFNWSPLTADAGFYTRAQELLTTALNKSPKPPIIVDDIIVTELNLGSIPPELEILEIGDLAEDRFRGIFKMCYGGDAFLTLKTRVQANPLNTYLSTRPFFASPQPLAAATGLTIPLQITLSDIKLSAFIILVFSKQKGLTLVFRNDPLESLKVSSTFDSIPFVRDYLQKEIEGQLRVLLMDELPAIIHRLSLRLWVPEYGAREDRELAEAKDTAEAEKVIDPLASPPQDAVDSSGHALNAAQIASLSLDSGVETQSLFSRKNLLRLAALTDSHRTLSLFTPSIPDAVFRAWAGPTERGEISSLNNPLPPAMSRSQSYAGSTTYSFHDAGHHSSGIRSPVGSSMSSIGLSMGAGRHSKAHGTRKRKKRVVNLRRTDSNGDLESVSGESTFSGSTLSGSAESAPASFNPPPVVPEEKEEEPITPPRSPQATVRQGKKADRRPALASISRPREQEHTLPGRILPSSVPSEAKRNSLSNAPRLDGASQPRSGYELPDLDATPRASVLLQNITSSDLQKQETARPTAASSSSTKAPHHDFLPFADPGSGGILEQAWMMRMASEIARRIQEEKERPPPAYAQ